MFKDKNMANYDNICKIQQIHMVNKIKKKIIDITLARKKIFIINSVKLDFCIISIFFFSFLISYVTSYER